MTQPISFRLATESDLPAIMTIVADARVYLREKNVPQWQGVYPTEAVFQADIKKGALWVAVLNQKIALIMTLSPGPDPNYTIIHGKWLQSTDNYLAIHRIAVARDAAGNGVAQAALEFARQFARTQSYPSLRFDTHELNAGMRYLAEKNNFTYCGRVAMADHTPRFAYELLLS